MKSEVPLVESNSLAIVEIKTLFPEVGKANNKETMIWLGQVVKKVINRRRSEILI